MTAFAFHFSSFVRVRDGFILYATAAVSLASIMAPAVARAEKPLFIDASAPFVQPAPADFKSGTSVAPNGNTLGMNSRYLMLNGKPWLPVMGEFHYARVPESQWEEEILKMKAAGVQIIAAYVFWIHHEEIEGRFDWQNERNLRHFVELCAKHGMYVFPRIGPWAHGEARNGGFPDWLLKSGVQVRRNDPAYMAKVGSLYAQVAEQLHGLLWKDGGPVIGLQLENEYVAHGPQQGAEYILALKKLAVADGLDVPIYSVTGWGGAAAPAGEVIPVFGGYPDAPWDGSLEQMPAAEVYGFRFSSRVTGNMGLMGAHPVERDADQAESLTPFVTAEMGGGIQDTYHRRPVVSADDIAAMMPVMLGSGVNLYGTYMFQGGQNPEGKLTTLQESQRTGYPTDLPVKSYDFQAPLGQYGLERLSLRKLKIYNYFLNAFGEQLAPMPVFKPAIVPTGTADLSTPRFSVRSDGESGFIFFNNYVRNHAMAAHPQTQFEVKLHTRTLRLPEKPIDLPADAYFIWPFHLQLGGLHLRYATAELMTKLDTEDGAVFAFACTPGVRCELALDQTKGLAIEAPGVLIKRDGDAVFLTLPDNTSHSSVITLKRPDGSSEHLLLLNQKDAENSWRVTVAGQTRLITTEADVFAGDEQVTLRSLGNPHFRFSLYPFSNQTPHASAALRKQAQAYTADLPASSVSVHVTDVRKAGVAPPVEQGPGVSWRSKGVAMLPSDSTFAAAAGLWRLELNNKAAQKASQDVSNIFLRITYKGDVARFLAAGHLLDDNFYNGEPWQVGLKRYSSTRDTGETGVGSLPQFDLQVLPLRSDAPIFLEDEAKLKRNINGQTVLLKKVEAIPQYQLTLSSR